MLRDSFSRYVLQGLLLGCVLTTAFRDIPSIFSLLLLVMIGGTALLLSRSLQRVSAPVGYSVAYFSVIGTLTILVTYFFSGGSLQAPLLNVWSISLTIIAAEAVTRCLSSEEMTRCFFWALFIAGALILPSITLFEWRQQFFGGTPKTNFGGWALLVGSLCAALDRKAGFKTLAFVFLFCILAGARSGALGSLLALGLLTTWRFRIIGGLALLIAVPIYANEFFYSLRLEDFDIAIANGDDVSGALNRFSSGRLQQYMLAVQWISNMSLTGIGLGERLDNVFIHNVALRLILEGGLLYAFFIFLLPMIAGFFLAMRAVEFLPLLLSGAFMTMLEPNFVFGTWSYSIAYWFGIGIMLSRSSVK